MDAQSAVDGQEIDLRGLLARIWGGKVLVAAVTSLAILAGALFAFGQWPIYEANSLVQLEEKSARLAIPESMSDLMQSDPRTETEIQIIRSRMVLGRAVADINRDWAAAPRLAPVIGVLMARYDLPLPDLDFLAAYARPGTDIRLDLIEVPPEWLGENIVLTLRERAAFEAELPDGTRIAGRVGEPIQIPEKGFSLRVGSLEGVPGRQFFVRQVHEETAIKGLSNGLSVSERGRGSGILELRFRSNRRDQAERALAAITRAYLDQNVARSAAEAATGLAFIEDQLPEAEAALREAERELNAYREAQQTIDLGLEGENLLTQVNALETQISELDLREDEISELYTQSHPVYRKLLNERARLEERLEALRGEIASLPETERELVNLTREREVAQVVYSQLLSRAQELRVLQASTIGNVRLIDSARATLEPVAPNKKRILVLAAMLGLFAGAGLVLVRNHFRSALRDPGELERIGLPVFATIGYYPKAERMGRRGQRPEILAITDSENMLVEGFRSLRTSLHFAMLDAPHKSVMLTSTVPGCGKSFTSVNLAAVVAQAGSRVCVVDADLRRGTLRHYFGASKQATGLSDILSGRAGLDQALRQGPIDNLCYITSGQFPPNPSELLMRQELSDLMDALDREFDLVLFDAPPVLPVTDPVILGRSVGTTLLVERYDVSIFGQVEVALATLQKADIRLAGAIVNGYDPRREYGGSAYRYAYQYNYEYRSRKS